MALGSVLGAAFCFPLGMLVIIICLVVSLVSKRRGSKFIIQLWMCGYLLNFFPANSLAGWIHLKLVQMANEANQAADPSSGQREVKSGVSAAIERLEGNLSK